MTKTRSGIVTIITMLIVFLIVLFSGIPAIQNYIVYKSGEIYDFNSLKSEDFEENMGVGGELYCSLDCIAEEYSTHYKIKTASQRNMKYYLVPIGENEYTLVAVTSKLFVSMNKLTDESYRYFFSGENKNPPRKVEFQGRVVPMDEELQQFVTDWFMESHFLKSDKPEDIKKQILPYMITYVNWSDTPKSFSFAVFGIIGTFALLMLYAVFFIIHIQVEKKKRLTHPAETTTFNKHFENNQNNN